MQKKTVSIEYYAFSSLEELDTAAVQLIESAVNIAGSAYVPYSHFPVGAAVRLADGRVFAGNNQENIAYPSGTCAERSVLNYVHGNYPDCKIVALAVTALHTEAHTPVTPCGFCRQVIVELEKHQQSPIQVILHKSNGPIFVFETAGALLPLAFEDTVLRDKK
jgi:cytidine deaminase